MRTGRPTRNLSEGFYLSGYRKTMESGLLFVDSRVSESDTEADSIRRATGEVSFIMKSMDV
jgi:hypothetical protein